MASDKTVHLKLNAPDDLRERLTAEMENAPTYVMQITPGPDGVSVASARKASDPTEISTRSVILTPHLAEKLPGDIKDVLPHFSSRYETIGELGEGGCAKVYEMLDHNMKRNVAVKLLKSQSSATDVSQFLSEGTLAAEMQHPNIIPVYDMDVDSQGHVFLTMKKVEGKSLAALIDLPGPPDIEKLILMCLKVCDALSFAHSKGAIHQDVKPENIMVGEYGEVFLIDWGASSEVGEEMQLSPVYMSPQQAAGYKPSTADDIYCLGASLFHVLTKRFPTQASTIDELWDKKLAGDVDPFTPAEQKHIPPRIQAIVMKAMALDPVDRYRTIDDFAKDLMNFQSDMPISAYRDSVGDQLTRFYRKHYALCNIAVASMIILSVATSYYLHRLGKVETEKFRALAQVEREEAEKLRAIALAEKQKKERQEAWHVVYEADFIKEQRLSENWNNSSEPKFDERGLRIGFLSGLNQMVWQKPVGSEQKIELEFDCDTLSYLEIMPSCSASGNGVRLGIGPTIKLYEKNKRDERPIASAVSSTHSVVKFGKPNKLTLWQRGHDYTVEINGKEILNYYDFMGHRSVDSLYFGIGRWFNYSPCYIRSIRVSTRVTPDYIKSLFIGKELLRNGDRVVAQNWFRGFVERSPDSQLVPEALMLLAKSLDDELEVEEALRRILTYGETEFRGEALHWLAYYESKKGDIPAALKRCREAVAVDPSLGTASLIIGYLVKPLLALPSEERRPYLKEFVRLAQISQVNLDQTGALPRLLEGNMDLLRGAKFSNLGLRSPLITDISMLKDMPIENLFAQTSRITDLSPLRGKQLRRLDISSTPVKDLSPLKGQIIDNLYINNCKQLDVKTLIGIQAHLLSLNGTPISDPNVLSSVNPAILRVRGCGLKDIGFVRGKRYFDLRLDRNEIKDLSPLSDVQTEVLGLEQNQITDLEPLRSCSIGRLNIANNPVSDISPLADLPIAYLTISNTQVRDFTPLLKMKKLRGLTVTGMELDESALQVLDKLPISELRVDNDRQYLLSVFRNNNLKTLNGLPTSHVRPVLAILQTVLAGGTLSPKDEAQLRRLGTQSPDGRDLLLLPIGLDYASAEEMAQKLRGQILSEGESADMNHLSDYMRGIVGPWTRCWIRPKSAEPIGDEKQYYTFNAWGLMTGETVIKPVTNPKELKRKRTVIIEWR